MVTRHNLRAFSLFASPPTETRHPWRTPLLASWERHDHPSQIALRDYVAELETLLESDLARHPLPLVVRLDVGLGLVTDLLIQRDLDNYLQPIADHLPDHVCSYWASKSGTVEGSTVSVAPAGPLPDDALHGWDLATARTTSSASSPTWRTEVRDQIATQAVPRASRST